MLNGIFGKWLREFATIVLTQTVQAFLLAIVMTVIISCLSNSTSDANGSNQAAGLLAIIALASFGKIEMLVKNIFGVTSQFGDPSLQNGARGLTATSMLAMRGGKRLLDNGTKLVDSHRKISEAKKGLAGLNSGSSSEGGEEGDTTSTIPGGGNKNGGLPDTEGIEDTLQTTMQVQGLDDIHNLAQAITKLNDTVQKQNSGSGKEKYEQMLKEGKELRRSAIRENIGGAIGGTAGALVGLAKGDDIVQTALAGAGAGDAIGQATAKRKAEKIDYNNRTKKLQEQIEGLTKEQYENNLKQLEEVYSKNGIGGAPRAIIRNIEKGAANGGGVKGAAKSVYSGAKSGVTNKISRATTGARITADNVLVRNDKESKFKPGKDE